MSKYVYEVYGLGYDYGYKDSSSEYEKLVDAKGNFVEYGFNKEKGYFSKVDYIRKTSSDGAMVLFEDGQETTTSVYLITVAPHLLGAGRQYVKYKIRSVTKSPKKGSLLKTITAEEGTYPDNGIQGDNWYVKVKKAIPTIKIDDKTVGAIKYKDSTGKIREISSVRYKDSAGNIRNLK